jgi:hypothetical protein
MKMTPKVFKRIHSENCVNCYIHVYSKFLGFHICVRNFMFFFCDIGMTEYKEQVLYHQQKES